MRVIILINIIFICLCCTYSKNQTNKTINDINCLSYLDSNFENGDYVKYIRKDSSIDIEIDINSKKQRLGWNMNCEMPHGLVPKFFKHMKNVIILKVGVAFSFRELILCEDIGNEIKITKYITELSPFVDKDLCIYKLNSDNNNIIIVNKISDSNGVIYKETKVSLPLKYKTKTFYITSVFKDYMLIQFLDKEEYKLLLPKDL